MNIWIDDEGTVRKADGPFVNRERVVDYSPEGYAPETTEELRERLLEYYKGQKIAHPLNTP